MTQISFFDPDCPVSELSGDLPHWRQSGVTYFVTFRLADSLPAEKLALWKTEQAAWLRQNPEPHTPSQREDYYIRFPRRLQDWLDAGSGSCILEDREVRSVVRNALLFFEGQRYQLGEFAIASNHVHVIITPLLEFELSDILHSWKSFTAHKILKIEAAVRSLSNAAALNSRRGVRASVGAASRRSSVSVWQKESFDHIVRSPESLEKFSAYIRAHILT